MVDVRYVLKDNGMRYDVYSPAKKINAHILLPKDKVCDKLFVNEKETAFDVVSVGASVYIDFVLTDVNNKTSIEILFK